VAENRCSLLPVFGFRHTQPTFLLSLFSSWSSRSAWWRKTEHARITSGALALRNGHPGTREVEKLIVNGRVVCQSSKPHVFMRAMHALVVGSHGGVFPVRQRGSTRPSRILKTSSGPSPRSGQVWPQRNR
jgi:hypothetical protein